MASSGGSLGIAAYRSAFLIATGLVAAYGTYLVYHSLTNSAPVTSPSRGLRRSNAVHRPSRTRHSPTVTYYTETHSRWPNCLITWGDHEHVFNIGRGVPSRAEVESNIPLPAAELDQFMHDLQVDALFKISMSCMVANEDDMEINRIRDILRREDPDELRSLESTFTTERWSFTAQAFDAFIERWISVQSHAIVVSPAMFDDAETLENGSNADDDRDSDQGLKALLYCIAEEEAKKQAYVHRGTRCDSCNKLPITGIRWHCINCPDFDLCSTCEALNTHPKTHVFAKVQIPICTMIQPRDIHKTWYTGNDKSQVASLEPALRTQIARETGFDEPQIDAYYEQYMCLSVERRDPSTGKIIAEIDKPTFHKAFVSNDSPNPISPNYVYDRMFAFYNTKKTGYIDFHEFISGLAYLLKPAKRISMDRIFHGYDSDEDGYISRADMVRMFRAKYLIHKAMILDSVIVEDEHGRSIGSQVREVLRSNRPISSLFADDDVPLGENRQPFNKPMDRYGDPQVVCHEMFSQPVLPNGQTDMDTSFWNAVFAKHGRPDRLADLHPQFNEKLDARIAVREQYIGTESIELDDGGMQQRYLVRADSRHRRPFLSTQKTLEIEWRHDISSERQKQSSAAATGRREEQSLDGVFERDRALAVNREERDIGRDVIYQTLDDGINELLDAFFKQREDLARRVAETWRDRKQHKAEIEAFVRSRGSQETAIETANDGNIASVEHISLNGMTGYTMSQPPAVYERSVSPSPSAMDLGLAIDDPATSQNDENQSVGDGETSVHITQSELVAHLRATALPTDSQSLETMERNIRENNLQALLQAAGYHVDSDQAEVGNDRRAHSTDPSLEPNHDENFVEDDPNHLDNTQLHMQATDRRHSALNDRLGLRSSASVVNLFITMDQDADDAFNADAEPIQDLPWTPESVRGSVVDRDAPDQDYQSADLEGSYDERSSKAGESEGEGDDELGVESKVELASARSPDEEPHASDNSSKNNDLSDQATSPPGLTPPGLNMGQQSETNGLDTVSNVPTDVPSRAQLAAWALLNEYEASMKKRGGPARINLKEFEDEIQRDRAAHGNLKGLVESWLEWAAF